MNAKSRRDFLRSCVASVSLPLLENRAWPQVHPKLPAIPLPYWSTRLERFIDPLPIPQRIHPEGKRGGALFYRVRMREFEKPLHSQLPPAKLWGYEGQCPGPLFEAMRGVPISVEWANELPKQHLFPIDTHIHGAASPAPAVRTVPHLHGSRTDSRSDGLPEAWFTPGHSVVFHYPNDQQAAPLWYHDHALGITRLNVYAGLSGFYFLRDGEELRMNLPAGDYEIPLVLQDRTLDKHGQLNYCPTYDDGTEAAPGRWGPQFFGELPIVNDAIYPRLDVEPRRYRFRLLNAANSRFFHLYLNLAGKPTDVPKLATFYQIGSDGGLLEAPVPLQRILLGPAERADLIVDFSSLEGKIITLSNDASAPYPGWDLLREIHPPLLELMQFRVVLPLTRSVRAFTMPSSIPLPPVDPADEVVTRDFVLSQRSDAQGKALAMLINNKGYDDPATVFPKLGSVEKWRFINTTDDSHPMHVHLVQFRIVERQGFDFGAFLRGKLEFVGQPRPPAPGEAGWKDTAIVNPQEVLTILIRFEGYEGKYVYHCHVAEHEDNDMMRPFIVVSAGAKPA